MKKFILVLLMFIIICSLAFAESAEYFSIGDYNLDVISIHEKLSELGYYYLRASSPWSSASIKALKSLQENMGIEVTGKIESKDQINEILSIDYIDLNLIWDGEFIGKLDRWVSWGSPVLCEITGSNSKNWMHLISSGNKFEGLAQNTSQRDGNTTIPELIANRTYVLTFNAYAADGSEGKHFTFGIHNLSTGDGNIQEQYWTPQFELETEPAEYVFQFTPRESGTFRIMIGTGVGEQIEAYFTNVRLNLHRVDK